MRGITYKSKHSLKDYGIVAKSISRPVLPTLRKRELSLSGKHGTYDFGGNTYENRQISVLLQYDGKTQNDLRLNSRDIAAWLSSTTYEPLIFDDEPDKYYLAKIYNLVDVNTFFRLGESTIIFECMPFAYYQATSGEDVLLDSFLNLDSDILLNPVDDFTFVVNAPTNLELLYDGTIEVGIDSSLGAKFDIVINGSFTNLTVNLNGKEINYLSPISDQTLLIDNVNANVELDNVNALFNCTGDLTEFFKLVPGINNVNISGTDLDIEVLFDFRSQYL